MKVRQSLLQLVGGVAIAAALVLGAQVTLRADECTKNCSCGIQVTCGGEGCTCYTFSGTWFHCGFMDNKGGCSYTCGGQEAYRCCVDWCPPEG